LKYKTGKQTTMDDFSLKYKTGKQTAMDERSIKKI